MTCDGQTHTPPRPSCPEVRTDFKAGPPPAHWTDPDFASRANGAASYVADAIVNPTTSG